jgi:hypothetical protein
MKKNLLLCISLIFQAIAYGQTVPNGGFESWTTATYDYPSGYPFNSNSEAFYRCGVPFNCVRTSDAYHGAYALQMTTAMAGTDTCFGFIVNTNTGGDPSTWTGGFPYNQMPTGMSGYYKSNIMPGDSGGILAEFRNNGSMIGMYFIKFAGTHNSYTPFSLTFSPPLPMAPDSLIIAMTSSDVFDNIAINGSMLQLDSISFTGGVSQPAQFNGDFEQWQQQTLDKLNSWYPSNKEGQGVSKTTDHYSGSYAVELTTYLGDNHGQPRTQAGQISTGFCSGDTNCVWEGGSSFTNQVDTLVFYYKYAPMSNDTAMVGLMFKHNGNVFLNEGTYITTPASTYQYAQIPFNLSQVPDTVIFQIQSSSWNDTTNAFIGSDFKVDNMYFKSQTVGINSPASGPIGEIVFPNPVKDVLNIRMNDHAPVETRLMIYDVTGRTVMKENFISVHDVHAVDASKLQPGVYMVELLAAGESRMSRFAKE